MTSRTDGLDDLHAKARRDDGLSRRDALDLIERVRTLAAEIEAWEARYPCDGRCYRDGFPLERCPRHGRTVDDVWDMADATHRDAKALTDHLRANGEDVDAILAPLRGDHN